MTWDRNMQFSPNFSAILALSSVVELRFYFSDLWGFPHVWSDIKDIDYDIDPHVATLLHVLDLDMTPAILFASLEWPIYVY